MNNGTTVAPFGLVPFNQQVEQPAPAGVLEGFEFSADAQRLSRMARSVESTARFEAIYGQANGRRVYPAMLTLTYRRVDDWEPRHISECLASIREHAKRKWSERVAYVWVAELQERGAVHYHVLLWLPHGRRLPKPDKRGWWRHGSTRIERAIAPAKYIAKYASKLDQKGLRRFPRGCRIHGRGGLHWRTRAHVRWVNTPAWVREAADIEGDWRPAEGGGYVSRATGEVMPSPFTVVVTGRMVRCVRDHARPARDGYLETAVSWASRVADYEAQGLGRATWALDAAASEASLGCMRAPFSVIRVSQEAHGWTRRELEAPVPKTDRRPAWQQLRRYVQ